MPRDILVSIVLGAEPIGKNPIRLEQIEDLARQRADVEVRVGNTGRPDNPDMEVVDPTGRAAGVLTLTNGYLMIPNPDPPTLQWMLDLAEALNGRVVDNTRRTYRTPTVTYIHPDDVARRARLARQLRQARARMRRLERLERIPGYKLIRSLAFVIVFTAIVVTWIIVEKLLYN